MPALKPDKLLHLEALRGLACLQVVASHVVLTFWPWLQSPNHSDLSGHSALSYWLASPPLTVLYNGRFAVCLFFVLSGFVLSYLYWHRPTSEILASAAARRYFRLALPMLAATWLAALVMRQDGLQINSALEVMRSDGWLPSHYDYWLLDRSREGVNLLEATQIALYGAFAGTKRTEVYSDVLWTMRVELLGSALVYAWLALFGSLRNRWLIYVTTALGLFLARDWYMCCFLAGMAFCDAYTQNWRLPAPAAVLTVLTGLWVGGAARERVGAVSLGAALLVVGICCWPNLIRCLSARPLVVVGALSFGIYLTHQIVLRSAGLWFYLVLRSVGSSHNLAAALGLAATLPCVGLVAWLMYRWVDQPAICLGKWIYTQWFRPKELRA